MKQLQELFPDADLSQTEPYRSPENLVKLKTYYAGIFSGARRSRITSATTFDDLEKAIDQAAEEGKRVHFTVFTRYKGLPEGTRDADVWTDFSDCGVHLLKGETYLVYAYRAENGHLETGACSRTVRLTDAGQDLAYLYFVNPDGEGAPRVFGFVTNTEADLRTPRLLGYASSPVSHLTVELRSPENVLLALTDRNGNFAFDGLAPGDYILSVFKDYLDTSDPLTEPQRVRISDEKCLEHPVYVPKRTSSGR